MPMQPDGTFARIWKFVDQYISGDNALRTAFDASFDDLTVGINAALDRKAIHAQWDASSGEFPSGSFPYQSYIVTVAGTVGGVLFAVDDVIISLVSNASTTTFSANWRFLERAGGPIVFATKAAADAALDGLANGDVVDVEEDESRNDYHTRYRVVSGALAFQKLLEAYRVYLNAPDFLLSVESSRGVGTVWQTGDGHTYIEAASGASDHHITNGADTPVKFYVVAGEEGYNIKAFGALGDGATNATTAVQTALNAGNIVVPPGSYLIAAGGLTWPAGSAISGKGSFVRSATPTGGCLVAAAAGTFRINGVTFDDGDHSAAFGCIETNHASAKLYAKGCFAHNGYAGIWAKQAALVDIDGGEFWDTSHNLYFGDNDVGNLSGTIERVTVRGVVSHSARTGGDGLKTVSGVKRLTVLGGRFYLNALDGIDVFAGCDEAMILGAECFANGVNGIDIKIGDQATYPYADWGQRRRIAIIGGYYNNNTQVGIKIYGEPAEGYFQDVSVQGADIIGNQIYGIQCRGVATRIIGNLLIGNAVSAASNYAVIYMHGDVTTKPKGGIIAHNVIGNNGVSGKTNIGINVVGWEGLLLHGNEIGNTADREEAEELDWGIAVDANSENIHVVNNQLGALNTYKANLAAGSCIVGINPGLDVLVKGTATILSGEFTATITHGAAGRPAANSQVRFWPIAAQAGATYPYSGATSTTQIIAAVSTAPSSDITVGWEVDLTGPNTYALLQ